VGGTLNDSRCRVAIPSRSLKSLSVNPQSRGSGIPKNKKNKMKKMVLKLLGLDTFVCSVDLCVELLRKENEELKKSLKDLNEEVEALEIRLTEKLDEMESPDLDEYVREDDINDRIESYLNDNDYVTQSYCEDEIESKVCEIVDEKVDEAVDIKIEDLDLEDKVKEVVAGMDKASFGDTEELKSIIKEQVKSFMLNSVKIDFIVR